MLSGGLRWKVGNGKSITVRQDAWLDGPGSSRVVSPCLSLSLDVTLDIFIDPVSKTWRDCLVRGTFLPFKANKILGIPINLDDGMHELFWVHCKDGVLYLNDVYYLALNSTEVAYCSKGPDPWWSKIWKLKVPPK